MRRIALLAACFVASVALIIFLVPARAAAPTAAGLHKGAAAAGAAHSDGVQLVRRGFRGYGFRGRGFRGGRAYAWRGGRVWRGGRYWRGPRWGWAVAPAVAAPFFYSGYRCPLVRRTVWTPRGYRVRWVRRC
jgi:hypothetical protein